MGLGNWGQELQNGAAAFFGSEYLRDYRHASKTFRSNSYANAPKYKFLFHTYFDINPAALGSELSSDNNFGLLVKDVKLPSFRFATHVLNQYNRKRIVQTKINYEPIQITFHDDNLNQIARMWYSYFTYYYKDATKVNVLFKGARGGVQDTGQQPANSPPGSGVNFFDRTTYKPNLQTAGGDDWGYIGETSQPSPEGDPTKLPFFKRITVFGFNQHNFTAYSFINPIITNFAHDTYNYEEGGGVMKNTMTIDYETVAYEAGELDGENPGNIVSKFGDVANYDRTKSSITTAGANGKVLGKGGLVDSAGGAIKKIFSGDLTGVKDLGQLYYNFKDKDLKSTLKNELTQNLEKQLTQTAQNAVRNNSVIIAINGATPSGSANAPTVSKQPSSPAPGSTTEGAKPAGQQINNPNGPVVPPKPSTARPVTTPPRG